MWVEGTAKLRVRIRSIALSSMTLRLAESLAVRSVATEEHGRLLYLRVIGQNSVIVNFPTALRRDTEISLNVTTADASSRSRSTGKASSSISRGRVQQQEEVYIPVEPQYIYSNRNYWYPQSTVTDYATSACASRCRRSSTSSRVEERRPPPAAAPARSRRPARPQAVCLRGRPADAVPVLRDQPLHPRRQPRRRARCHRRSRRAARSRLR